MLAETLQRLNADGRLTVREASSATGLAPSTIYNWLSGSCEPGWGHLLLLFRHGNDDVRQALLDLLVAGTPWSCTAVPVDMDLNGDGDVDADDVYDGTIAALRITAQALEAQRVALGDGRLTPIEAADLRERVGQTMTQMVAVRRVIDDLAERVARRRKCRALVAPNGRR